MSRSFENDNLNIYEYAANNCYLTFKGAIHEEKKYRD